MEQWLRPRTKFLIDPVVNALAKLGVTPNGLTVFGALLNVVAGALIALGQPFWGGVMMTVIAMPADALDGSLARATGRQTKFGGFLDSVLDRVAEGAILLGMAWWFLQRGDATSTWACFFALLGSIMVSYTRARAEGLGLECKVGLFSRFGRFVLMALGLLAYPLFPQSLVVMVWALAVLSTFTAIQRIVYVYRIAD